MITANKTHTPLRLVAVLIFALWWLIFLGFGQTGYSNGLLFSSQGASISRDFKSASFVDWDNFNANNVREQIINRGHDGYNILLASTYLLAGDVKLHYGNIVSFFFVAAGVIFLLGFAKKTFTPFTMTIGLLLTFTNTKFMIGMIKPLTDPLFWGILMALLWSIVKFPKQYTLFGAIVGLAYLFRFQAILTIPFALILCVQEHTVKDISKAFLWFALGLVPFILINQIINIVLFEVPPLDVSSANHAISYGMNKITAGLNPAVSIKFLFKNIEFLASLYPVLPLAFMLLPSLFIPARNEFIYRLRWAVLIGIICLIVPFGIMLQDTTPFRYHAIFITLISFLIVDFFESLAQQCPKKFQTVAKTGIALLLIMPIFFGTMNTYRIASQASWDNVVRYDWDGLKRQLKGYPDNAVFLTNNAGTVALVHPTRSLVIAPYDIENFLQGNNNSNVDAIVLIYNMILVPNGNKILLPKSLRKGAILPNSHIPPWLSSWEPYVNQNTITDHSGNVFTMKYQSKDDLFRTIIYVRSS